MNPIFKLLMGGPGTAMVRYAMTAIGGALVSKGYVTAENFQTIAGAVIAAAPAIIGTISATRSNVMARVADLPNTGVKLPDGTVAYDAATVKAKL